MAYSSLGDQRAQNKMYLYACREFRRFGKLPMLLIGVIPDASRYPKIPLVPLKDAPLTNAQQPTAPRPSYQT